MQKYDSNSHYLTTTTQKMKFSMKGFFITFTEEILNEKLHFLCNAVIK